MVILEELLEGEMSDVLVEEEIIEGVVETGGDKGLLHEIKTEPEGEDVGPAMQDFLRRRGGVVGEASGSGGLIPGVEVLPGGRVPELLGFSSEEIVQLLPSRASGPSVPYLGEPGVPHGIRRKKQPGGSSKQPRPCQSLSERRRKQKKPSFGSGRPIRLLTTINQDPRNRPLQLVRREVNLPVVPFRRPRGVNPFGEGWGYTPQSWHRQKYHESTEGFGKTGRYHPTDARLEREGTFKAICEDLELYKIPPADWWPP